MAKKSKVNVQRSEDFQGIDEELSAAMEGLDATNARIVDLLESLDPPEEGGEDAAAGEAESS